MRMDFYTCNTAGNLLLGMTYEHFRPDRLNTCGKKKYCVILFISYCWASLLGMTWLKNSTL